MFWSPLYVPIYCKSVPFFAYTALSMPFSLTYSTVCCTKSPLFMLTHYSTTLQQVRTSYSLTILFSVLVHISMRKDGE